MGSTKFPGSEPPLSSPHREEQSTLLEDVESPSTRTALASEKTRCLLTVLSGPAQGTVLRVQGDLVTLGRSEEADALIDDPSLSRIHARIIRQGGGYFLADNESTNGTFLGEGRVESIVPIKDGDRFRLGLKTLVKFSLQDRLEEEATLRLYESALRDRLTGAYNRGVFDDRLESEFAFAHRHGTLLSLLMFDIDHFKNFNDRYGHQAGDLVLQTVAMAVQRTVRTEDTLARYGGEEFAVIARGISTENARILAERIRQAVERLRVRWNDQELQITVSVGLATMTPELSYNDTGALVAITDKALYQAKSQGRNRCLSLP